ncbi:MAG TPA: hypothetical protein DD417_11925 [Elusimicrobia bacterium]|nr:hypothetical protein [Elusimicrobiota bacterium]
MKRVLFIADGAVRLVDLEKRLPREPGELRVVWLGAGSLSAALLDGLRHSGWRVCLVSDAARRLVEETEALRPVLIRWACDLGEIRVAGRRVKEHLLIPGQGWSVWWAGLLSEKNTFKTPLFFRLIQLSAVRKLMADAESCIFAVREPVFAESLGLAATAAGRPFVFVRIPGRQGRWGLILRGMATAMSFLLKTAWRCGHLRLVLGSPRLRAAACAVDMVVSYFPLLDRRAAAEGRFVSRHFAPLQEMVRGGGGRLSWLFIYFPLEGWSFRDAVGLVRRFSGESMFFWEEFLSWRDIMAAVGAWLRGAWVAERILTCIEDRDLVPEEIGPAGLPLVRALWRLSFLGAGPMEGALFHAAFSEVGRTLAGSRRWVYLCEMMAWEKALNAAKRRCRPDILTVGFQHSTLCRNFLNHYYDPREIDREGTDSDLPLPDVLAAGGRLLAEDLRRSGYQNVRIVESLRYLYLNRLLIAPPDHPKGRKRLVVVGTIDREETLAVLRLAADAFPVRGETPGTFVPHPALPLAALGAILPGGIPAAQKPLLEELALADFVLVGASTVAVEALAHGCVVLEPVFAHVMRMNPLSDYPGYCRPVYGPEDLRRAVMPGAGAAEPEAARRFVREYWDLDESLPAWRGLLFGADDRVAGTPRSSQEAASA